MLWYPLPLLRNGGVVSGRAVGISIHRRRRGPVIWIRCRSRFDPYPILPIGMSGRGHRQPDKGGSERETDGAPRPAPRDLDHQCVSIQSTTESVRIMAISGPSGSNPRRLRNRRSGMARESSGNDMPAEPVGKSSIEPVPRSRDGHARPLPALRGRSTRSRIVAGPLGRPDAPPRCRPRAGVLGDCSHARRRLEPDT
jgi:hypothetical protein